jgi:hypothetical protein
MKKLILFFLLLAGTAYGQTNNTTNTKFTNGLAVPNGVSQKPTSGLTAGSLSYVTGAGLYVYNGSAWELLGLSSGGVTSFNARTGVVVPLIGDYSSFYVPLTRSLTINGATQTLAADRTWTITANTPNSLSTGYGLTGGVFDGSVARTYAADTSSVSGLVSKLRLATNLTGYVKKATTITINGVTQDLSDNRTYNVGTVTSITPGYGLTPQTAITSTGGFAVDILVLDTVYAKISGTGNYIQNQTGSNLAAQTAKFWVTDTIKTSGKFVGDLTGNAATVTTNANLTGPITSVGNATSIASQTGTGSTFAMSASPTFTGLVSTNDGISQLGTSSIIRHILSADNNVAKILSFRTANLPRWAFRVDGNETGANVGGDIALRRYNDAGVFIDNVWSAVRSTGITTFGQPIAITGGTSAQFLMGNGSVQDTTTIQTVANFFPKGDTRYYTKTQSDLNYIQNQYASKQTANAWMDSLKAVKWTTTETNYSTVGAGMNNMELFKTTGASIRLSKTGQIWEISGDDSIRIFDITTGIIPFKIQKGTGATTLIGTVTAPTFIGALTGNSSTTTLAANSTLWGGIAYGGPYLPLTAGSGVPLSATLYSTVSSGDNINLSKGTGASIQLSRTTATAQSWGIAGEANFKIYNYTAGTTPYILDISGNNTWTGSGTMSSLTLSTTPTTSSGLGTNEVLIRDETTGIIGKKLFSSFALISGANFTGTSYVPTLAYGVGWNGSNAIPTRTDVYTKIETLAPLASPVFTTPIRLKGYTVSTLPAGTQGDTAAVTDATVVPAKGVAPVAGGAAYGVVVHNGTIWVGI